MFPKDTFIDFETIKKTVSMIQILDHYGLTACLNRAGDQLRGACPIHGGHNETQFSVNLSRNCWNCFGDCHAGGSILDFVSRKEKVSVREAGLLIGKWFGINTPWAMGAASVQEKTEKKTGKNPPDKTENPPLPDYRLSLDRTHPYLGERGLSPETASTFGIGHWIKGSMAGRILIPIHNEKEELVSYAGRWPGEPPDDRPKYLFLKGFKKSLEVFNYHRANKVEVHDSLVIVEGFFGCMKVWQAGFHRVVAVMGSTISETQESLILKAVGSCGKVDLMFDEDPAGRKGREKARARLAPRVNLRVIEFGKENIQPEHLSPDEIRALLK